MNIFAEVLLFIVVCACLSTSINVVILFVNLLVSIWSDSMTPRIAISNFDLGTGLSFFIMLVVGGSLKLLL